MKKHAWFIAALTALVLVFAACGGSPADTSGKKTEGIDLRQIFSATPTSQDKATVSNFTKNSVTFSFNGDELWGELVTPEEAPWDASPYTAIKFQYKATGDASFFIQTEEFYVFKQGDGDGWGANLAASEWTDAELSLSVENMNCQDGGWILGQNTPFDKEYVRKLIFQIKDSGPQAKKFELRNFQLVADPAYVPPTLESIEVKDNPSLKTLYVIDEPFSTEGLEVVGVWSNGKEKAVTDYTLSAEGIANLEDGDTAITASPGEKEITVAASGKETTFTINVVSSLGTLQSISVSGYQVNYAKDEPFTTTGLVVTATYEDGQVPVTSGYTLSAPGIPDLQDGNTAITATPGAEIEITVTYGGQTDTFTIKVNPGVTPSGPWYLAVAEGGALQWPNNETVIGEGEDTFLYIYFTEPGEDFGKIKIGFSLSTGANVSWQCAYDATGTWGGGPGYAGWGGSNVTFEVDPALFTQSWGASGQALNKETLKGICLKISGGEGQTFTLKGVEFLEDTGEVIIDSLVTLGYWPYIPVTVNDSNFVTPTSNSITVTKNPADGANGAFRVTINFATPVDMTTYNKGVWFEIDTDEGITTTAVPVNATFYTSDGKVAPSYNSAENWGMYVDFPVLAFDEDWNPTVPTNGQLNSIELWCDGDKTFDSLIITCIRFEEVP